MSARDDVKIAFLLFSYEIWDVFRLHNISTCESAKLVHDRLLSSV